jgi:hypothetical protein
MVTDEQVRTLRTWLGKEASLTFAAAKAGMDRKTARKHRHADRLPSQRAAPAGQRSYRTREDPFAGVWSEVEALLEESSGWEAKTLLEELQRRHPGQFSEKHLRTMQRRIKHWRATRGPDKEVFFAQEHLPGRLGASDFTHMTDLGVTINGQPFAHLVYHFVLTRSNWEHVTLCFSESFESFSEGFQNAAWALGGVPAEHRSDRMSLAVQASGSEFFTRRYQALMRHYEVRPQAINAGKGHENGDAEQSHHRFKRGMKQALLRRGSHDFPSQEAYQAFLGEVCASRNAERRECFVEERKHLRPLPARRLESFRQLKVRVQSGSTITVERNIYSVPARLIDEWVEARVYADVIEVWYGQRKQELLPRLRGRHKHRIDYRHVIGWLVRKPGAFAGYRYRAELFPTSRFRMAYDVLAATASGQAAREYLGILHLAARQSEVEVDEALRRLLEAGGMSLAAVEALLQEGVNPARALEVNVEQINLSLYDELFENKEVWHEEGRGEGGEAATGGLPEGTAPANDAGDVRGGGGAGAAGIAELRALPAGTGESGVRRTEAQARGTITEGVAAAVGEEPGDVRPEAASGEGAATSANAADGRIRGSEGEHPGLRDCRLGKDTSSGGDWPGIGAAAVSAGVLQPLRLAGAGTVGGETGLEVTAVAETSGVIRGGDRGRSGLRAAEPGGDGSAVRLHRGALRAGQRAVDEQPAVLEVGGDFSRSDDDGSGDRPISASQHDRRIEPAELPGGASEESEGKTGT